eukprot:CAMPEP_0184869056 /NCGR_PEP_ID=MMETSP0580-20130426/32669_1 /TAXON_ID=1118495 /ORGANISM="Dactyliosolen fragilissimus" /LENGTH=70 /DNA_ID=CAMNT_0027370289 /DNA_START=101 /DNA_END=309 /DNA_ORIENTATION=-
MNKVADIRKWLTEMEKQNQPTPSKTSKVMRELNLPINKVASLKKWLMDIEAQNRNHKLQFQDTRLNEGEL